jgi:transcriptional regulator with XRE-family HTH domain
MYDIRQCDRVVREARHNSYLTQRELAERVGTSQSAIASLERGDANPTIDTLIRCAEAAGFSLRIAMEPLPVADPVIERYKRDVDRASLRENLRRSVDERLRTLSEWQHAGHALAHAVRAANSTASTATTRGASNRQSQSPKRKASKRKAT